ncbi:hypothetical protein L3X38_004844 [Prunus dulcis]|uniref:Uncharacterized protein n=1 Tax=Prunus dulcis TaxID=3755 RepID=A0AAD4ZPM1_PRUDU|nr:hypothetical protein L3X38_004844 [Prunus dulcis]
MAIFDYSTIMMGQKSQSSISPHPGVVKILRLTARNLRFYKFRIVAVVGGGIGSSATSTSSNVSSES